MTTRDYKWSREWVGRGQETIGDFGNFVKFWKCFVKRWRQCLYRKSIKCLHWCGIVISSFWRTAERIFRHFQTVVSLSLNRSYINPFHTIVKDPTLVHICRMWLSLQLEARIHINNSHVSHIFLVGLSRCRDTYCLGLIFKRKTLLVFVWQLFHYNSCAVISISMETFYDFQCVMLNGFKMNQNFYVSFHLSVKVLVIFQCSTLNVAQVTVLCA